MDDIVLFKGLTKSELELIVDLMVADVGRRLADRRIALEVTPAARSLIAERGYMAAPSRTGVSANCDIHRGC